MGYASTVGTMVLNEVAYVNKRSDQRMDAINTDLVRLERDVERGHDWSRRMTNEVLALERGQADLEREQMDMNVEQAFMRGEIDQMRQEMDGLLHLNQVMHDVILNLRVAIHHNRHNPIVVEDDEVVDVTGPLPVRIREEDLLVEIIEETPPRGVVDDRDSSPKL